MKFPDFIIAGCMKAGTTSLFINLSKHPDITMSGFWGPLNSSRNTGTGTEINYWDNWKNKYDLNWYKSRFDGSFSGEKSPGYWTHMGAIRQIYKNNFKTKFILCFRHPVERAHSHYMMNRLRTLSEKPFDFGNVKSIHLNFGKYYQNLQQYILKVIPKENIYIIISDWMKTNTTEEMMKIHKFLGLKEIEYPIKKIEWGKKVSLYEASQDKTYAIWDSHSKKKINLEARKIFLDFYKKDNEDLFNFLGYDIPEWRL
jgi:hypothetical protein